MHLLLGYGSFRQYVEERLGLPARAVEQRVALEKRLWDSPALQEARRQGVSYEKLRVLARLPEADIAAWIPRALEATCIALKREVEGEHERQMRARQKMLVPLPRRVAVLLAAAIEAVRGRFGRVLTTGTCLAVMAFHFLASWRGARRRSKTRSQKVRDRDLGLCQVPGCSRRAVHSHHIDFPLARRQRRPGEPGRSVRLPPPAVHPRRLPRRVRTGAGPAHMAVGREGLEGTAVLGRRPAGQLNRAVRTRRRTAWSSRSRRRVHGVSA